MALKSLLQEKKMCTIFLPGKNLEEVILRPRDLILDIEAHTNFRLGTLQGQKAVCSALLEIFGLKVWWGTPKRLFPSKN